MNNLPPEILLNIARQAVTGSRPNIKILLVCSDFFLAAIPIIYHSPFIKNKLTSFFLHSIDSLQPIPSRLSDRQLVQTGHTKLAAFRHVYNLHLVGAGTIGPRSAFERNRHTRDVEIALESLSALQVGFLPKLNSVQCGDTHIYTEYTYDEGRDDFLEVLLGLTTPRIWCQNDCRLYDFESAVAAIRRDRPDYHPPTLHIHSRIDQGFQLVLGGTTHVYLQKQFLPRRTRGVSGPEAITSWRQVADKIYQSIIRSFEEVASRRRIDKSVGRKMIASSRIIISGIGPEPEGVEDLGEPSVNARELSRRRGSSIVNYLQSEFRQHRLSTRFPGDPIELDVEIRLSDGPLCPGCGVSM